MNNLLKLISGGENEGLEFKESLRLKEEIGQTVSAFSNANGGLILKERAEKPVFFKNHAYKRVGKTNQQISSSEMRKLAKESGAKVYWDERVCKEASLEDIDWEFVKNFFIPGYEKFSKKRIIGTPAELLEALSCVKEGKPTNAGILLFGKNPQNLFRNSYIALARYKGTVEGVERLDYKEFLGNLFHQIDECDKYIKEHTAIMSRLLPHKVEREDIPEYCWFSIRELITNFYILRERSLRKQQQS